MFKNILNHPLGFHQLDKNLQLVRASTLQSAERLEASLRSTRNNTSVEELKKQKNNLLAGYYELENQIRTIEPRLTTSEQNHLRQSLYKAWEHTVRAVGAYDQNIGKLKATTAHLQNSLFASHKNLGHLPHGGDQVFQTGSVRDADVTGQSEFGSRDNGDIAFFK